METLKENLDMLFNENTEDQTKNQDYKNNWKEYELPEKYFILEMYNKQKELQQFLAKKGKTSNFPSVQQNTVQSDVQLAIYHLFCMQVEYQELKHELEIIQKYEQEENATKDWTDARFELIDMFFFMFNVGIYTGLDIMSVINTVEELDWAIPNLENWTDTTIISEAIDNIMNYIDKLPWKAWKEYDYSNFIWDNYSIKKSYAIALWKMITWAKQRFNETDKSLFNLYMNKWEENRRRQEDINSGYILSQENSENPDINQ